MYVFACVCVCVCTCTRVSLSLSLTHTHTSLSLSVQRPAPFSQGGGLNYWGPTMNIGRDPRWGRFQESVSEDPWLNGAYSFHFVQGLQGEGDGVKYVKIAACCKHFYAYSLEDSDGFTRHNFNAAVTARDLAETYLPPFAACVAAKPEQVMCSYNAVNGVPTCLDDKAQNGWLRERQAYKGSYGHSTGTEE